MAELNRDLPSYWMHLDYHEQQLREMHPSATIARGHEQVEYGRWVYLSSGSGWVRIMDARPDRYGQVLVQRTSAYPARVFEQQVRDAAESHQRPAGLRQAADHG